MADRTRARIGVDRGKTHHWVGAVDENGRKLLWSKVLNDESQILEVMTAVGEVSADRAWVIDSALPHSCWSRFCPGRRAGALRLRANCGGDEPRLHRRR